MTAAEPLTIGQLRELFRTSTDADVVRACLVAFGDAHFMLDGTPSDEACAAADVIVLRAWGARNVVPSEMPRDTTAVPDAVKDAQERLPVAAANIPRWRVPGAIMLEALNEAARELTRVSRPIDSDDEVIQLRERWEACLPFVEAMIQLWKTDVFCHYGCRQTVDSAIVSMADAAISKLGALANTFSSSDLIAMPGLLGEALRAGGEIDALLVKTREWSMPTEEEADRELAEAGGDPDTIGKRGAVLVEQLLRMRRERSGVYGPTPNEPGITDDEILDLYYIANRDNDAKMQTLCEIARGDGEVTRRIAR